MVTYLETSAIETYIAGVAARAGVSVRWEKAGSVPRTDGRMMYLPSVDSTATAGYLTALRYYVKHETSHIEHTDFAFWQSIKPQGMLMFIINLLEDNRIDYLNDAEYPGDVRLSSLYWEDYANKTTAMLADSTLSDDMQKVAPLFYWDSLHRDWIDSSHLVTAAIAGALTPEQHDKVDILGGFSERLINIRYAPDGATTALLALAKDILKALFNEDAEPYMKPEGGAGDSKGEDGEGKAGESDGDTLDGEGEGKESKEDKIITVPRVTEKMGEHIVSRTGTHMEHEVTDGAYSIPHIREYKVGRFPLSSDFVRDMAVKHSGYLSRDTVQRMLDEHTKPLANKLRMKLQVRSKGHYSYNLKAGRINAHSLHKIVTGKGTEQESRLFKKHSTTDTLDTAVTLLVDCSGSMSGYKFEVATAAALSVAAALKPLHISHNVLGFTNTLHNDDPAIWVFSDFGESVSQSELINRFDKASGSLYENTDGDGIAWAYHNLMQRKEKRKILIVYSDGAPAGRYHAGDIVSYTKQVVESIEKAGKAEVYGVGIFDHNVKKYYTNNVVIDKAEELAAATLSILDKAI